MSNNPRMRVQFLPTRRYTTVTMRNPHYRPGDNAYSSVSYRARRPVVVALAVATAFAMMLASTIALLWWLNC